MKLIELEWRDGGIDTLRADFKNLLDNELFRRKNLIYRGFNKEMIKQVLKYGSENPNSDRIYASEQNYLWEDNNGNPLFYFIRGGALAIYHGDMLRKVPDYDFVYEFRFKDPKVRKTALVAIVTRKL